MWGLTLVERVLGVWVCEGCLGVLGEGCFGKEDLGFALFEVAPEEEELFAEVGEVGGAGVEAAGGGLAGCG